MTAVVDPRTGEKWGGVVRNHGKANLEFPPAGLANFYVGGGGETLTGTHVASNSSWSSAPAAAIPRLVYADAGGPGGSRPSVFRLPTRTCATSRSARAAISARKATLRGRYFPVDWRARSGDLAWRLGGTVGYFQTYREKAARSFPLDPGPCRPRRTRRRRHPTLKIDPAGLEQLRRRRRRAAGRCRILGHPQPAARSGCCGTTGRPIVNEARGMLFLRALWRL